MDERQTKVRARSGRHEGMAAFTVPFPRLESSTLKKLIEFNQIKILSFVPKTVKDQHKTIKLNKSKFTDPFNI